MVTQQLSQKSTSQLGSSNSFFNNLVGNKLKEAIRSPRQVPFSRYRSSVSYCSSQGNILLLTRPTGAYCSLLKPHQCTPRNMGSFLHGHAESSWQVKLKTNVRSRNHNQRHDPTRHPTGKGSILR